MDKQLQNLFNQLTPDEQRFILRFIENMVKAKISNLVELPASHRKANNNA